MAPWTSAASSPVKGWKKLPMEVKTMIMAFAVESALDMADEIVLPAAEAGDRFVAAVTESYESCEVEPKRDAGLQKKVIIEHIGNCVYVDTSFAAASLLPLNATLAGLQSMQRFAEQVRTTNVPMLKKYDEDFGYLSSDAAGTLVRDKDDWCSTALTIKLVTSFISTITEILVSLLASGFPGAIWLILVGYS